METKYFTSVSTDIHPVFLFHSSDFIFRNPEQEVFTFSNRKVRISFTRNSEQLISIERSPFGGFVANKNVSKEDIEGIVKEFTDWAFAKGIASVVIRCFPEVYDEQLSKLINEALLNSGFTSWHQDVTQVLEISGRELKMNVHRQRRLRKCQAEGYVFKRLDPSFLPEAYERITESRKDKGYPITMSLAELEKMFNLFPQHYFLFGVMDQSKLIATCVVIKVSDQILSGFYIGDALAYRQMSPVTMLINGLYDFASQNNYQLIDLGISTDKGVLNEGLYAFKKSLGCIDSYKLTFLKQF
jgi:hypothetical protein